LERSSGNTLPDKKKNVAAINNQSLVEESWKLLARKGRLKFLTNKKRVSEVGT